MRALNFTVLLLLSFSFSSIAQISKMERKAMVRYATGYSHYTPLNLPVHYRKQEAYLAEKGVKTMTIVSHSYSKKGKKQKPKHYKQIEFNDVGKMVSMSGAKYGKELQWKTNYSYDDKNYVKQIVSYNGKNQVTSKQVHHRSANTNVVSDYFIINKKGDTASRSIQMKRDSVTNTSEDFYYKKGKLVYKWLNEYYPTGSQKRTTFYNGKGKELYVWDYSCKEEGVETKKHKDTSTVCVSRVYDADSTLTVVTHQVNEKGVIVKRIRKKNKAGNWFYYKTSTGSDDVIKYESNTTYKNDTLLVSTESRNYFKGNISSHSVKQYDENKNETSYVYTSYKKGEVDYVSNIHFEYDDLNRPVKRVVYNEVKKPRHVTEYSYN